MFDLYLVVTPFLGLIAFLTLINLKLTLKEPQFDDLPRYVSKPQKQSGNKVIKSSSIDQQQSKKSFTKTLFYLITNFTFLDLILVRRARNKISIFLSFFIQLTLVYFFGFSFYFSAVGILINLIFFTVKVVSESLQQNKSQNDQQTVKEKFQTQNGRKLQILMSTISLLLNIGLIWIFYKNFNNSLITKIGINIGIIFAIDNFAVKPFALGFVSLPISFSDNVNHFIKLENQIVEILHKQKILQQKKRSNEELKNPQKIFVSTSHTENTIQIQPYVNLDPHQNILQSINPVKNVSLQKITSIRKRPSKQYNRENSSMNLLETHLPIQPQNRSVKNILDLKSLQKNPNTSPQVKENIDEFNNSLFFKKKTKIYTENVDFIDENKIHNPQIKNNDNSDNQDPVIATPKSTKFLKQIKFTNSARKNFEKSNEKNNNFSNSYEKEPYQNYQKTQHINDQNHLNYSYGSNLHNSAGKNDLLKIYEDKIAEDLGQIDANSPYRRRKPFEIKLDEINSKSNQNKKKFSYDPSKKILQQSNTSHFPDYLQKTYVEQSHEKKRMSLHQVSDLNLSRKSDAFSKYSNNSRISKSFKRTIRSKDPIVRQNDQNRIPEFVIEDFTY